MESAASGLSHDSPSAASTAATSSWLLPRLPSYGLQTSSTSLTRSALLFGSADYVSNALGRRAATVETLVGKLVQLPLPVQSQFLLLRAPLQTRMAHLMRTVPREALAAHMRRTDAAAWRAAAVVLDLPPGVGEYGSDMGAWTRRAACWAGR